MKFVSKIAMLAMALTSNVFAQQQPTGAEATNSYSGGGGWTEVVPGTLSGNAYTMGFRNMKGFSFKSTVAGATAPYEGPFQDKPTNQPGYNYRIPNGSTVYVMGLGKDWGKMSKDLEQVDIKKALANGTINDGNFNVTMTVREKPCETVNFVVVTPAGGRFWGHHPDPDKGWVLPNVGGSPRTAWCVKGNAIVKTDDFDPSIRTALAKKE